MKGRSPKPRKAQNSSLSSYWRIGSVIILILGCILVMISSSWQPKNIEIDGFEIVDLQSGIFGKVAVVHDKNNERLMLVSNKCIMGGVHLDDSRSSLFRVFPIQTSIIYALSERDSQRILNLGLGAGYAPSELRKLDITVDVVEIDTVVVNFAKKYYNFTTKGRTYIEDARMFIDREYKQKSHYYSAVIHDIFIGSTAAHLVTVETFQKIKQMLKPDGTIVFNFCGIANTDALQAVWNTLGSVWLNVRCFQDSPEDPNGLNNFIFFASDQPIKFRFPPALLKEASQSQEWGLRWIQVYFERFEVLPPDHPSTSYIIADDNQKEFIDMQSNISDTLWVAIKDLLPDKIWELVA